MARYIKGKDGKFAGSIGTGKIKTPQPAPKIPALTGSYFRSYNTALDAELADIGLTTSTVHHDGGAHVRSITDAPALLDDMSQQLPTGEHVLDTYPPITSDREQFEENIIAESAAVEKVRVHLFYAHEHLSAETYRQDSDPREVYVADTREHADQVAQMYIATAQDGETFMYAQSKHTSQSRAVDYHLERAATWLTSTDFHAGVDASTDLDALTEYRARTQWSRFHIRQARAHLDSQDSTSGADGFTTPPVSAFLASTHSAAGHELHRLRGLVKLTTTLSGKADSHHKKLAMTHLQQAQNAIYALS